MAQMVCPELIGRDEELATLVGELDTSLSRPGRVVVVSGEAGIGKSRLVGSVAEYARGRGVRVLEGRTAQVGSPVPFRPFAEALQAAVGPDELRAASVQPYQALLARVLAIEGVAAPVSDPSPLAVMEALRRLLHALAEPSGLVLVLEDVHWADPETFATVHYLADKLDDTPLLCVLTERTNTSDEAAELIGGLVARRLAARVMLGPLGDEQVAALTRGALATDNLPVALIEGLRSRCEGVPFLVEELLSAYVDAGGQADWQPEWWISRRIAEALPPSYVQLVRERLARLDPSARSLASVAAVLGRGFDWKLLAPVTELPEHAVLDGLRAAVRAQLLTTRGDHYAVTFEFRHALAREAVLSELLPPVRAELSRRAAQAIEATYPGVPGEWCERAAELHEAAGQHIDAARLLQEAARRMLSRAALESAERTLRRARDLAADDWMTWMGADDRLLDVLALAGKPEGVVDLGQRLIDTLVARYSIHNTSGRLADIHFRIARALLPTGNTDGILAHLDEAERLAESIHDRALLARTAAARAQLLLTLDDVRAAAKTAAHAQRLVEPASTPEIECEVLYAVGSAATRSGDTDAASSAFARVAELAHTPKLTVWHTRALLQLGTIDRLLTGDTTRLEEAASLAAASGAVATHASVELQLAHADLDKAQTAQAALRLVSCAEACRLYRLPLLADVLLARCVLHALSAQRADLQAAASEALAVGADPSDVIGDGSAVLAVADGDDQAALAHLRDAATNGDGGGQTTWRGLHALLEAALADDDGARRALASSPAWWHPANQAYERYATAVGLGRNGDSEGALAAYAAADAAMITGWRKHHARRVVATAALAANWGDPVTWTQEALDFFETAKLPGLAASCRTVLRRAGAPVRRRGRGESEVPPELHRRGVTSREMDVLHLVAERLSNRDIADRLFLSPRTIESHVATLVRKCGVESRAALAAVGRRHNQPAGEPSTPGS